MYSCYSFSFLKISILVLKQLYYGNYYDFIELLIFCFKFIFLKLIYYLVLPLYLVHAVYLKKKWWKIEFKLSSPLFPLFVFGFV